MPVRYYRAQDTFVAGMPDGTEQLVKKGDPLPETHELVKRDLEAAKGNPGRIPLFRLLDDDAGDALPAKPKPAARKAAAGNG